MVSSVDFPTKTHPLNIRMVQYVEWYIVGYNDRYIYIGYNVEIFGGFHSYDSSYKRLNSMVFLISITIVLMEL